MTLDAVKFADPEETIVVGHGIPFDGPFNGGKDLDGEFFTKSTDFCLDWYADRPLLFHHGRDKTLERTVIGRVKTHEIQDEGVWVEAQLDVSSKYFEAIKRLVKAGKLFFSSGAVPHLVVTDRKSGEIKVWPWIEMTLTPTPSNFLAQASTKATPLQSDDGDPPEGSYEDMAADIARASSALLGGNSRTLATFGDHAIVVHYPGFDADEEYGGPSMEPDYYRHEYSMGDDGEPVLGSTSPVNRVYATPDGKSYDMNKAVLTTKKRNNLSKGQFAWVDDNGNGHLPIHDAAHVRNALARFSQTKFPDTATKRTAWGKIVVAADKFKIEVGTKPPGASRTGKTAELTNLQELLKTLDANFDGILSR